MKARTPADREHATAVLVELHRLSGAPSYRALSEWATGLSHKSVANLLQGTGSPRPTTVTSFIEGCLRYVTRHPHGANLTADQKTPQYWHRRYQDAAGRPVDGQRVCPYPGLASFGREHARWFYGRDLLVEELVDRLDQRLRRGGIQMIMAPSGAGKSSLLRAGLLPRLAEGALPGSADWPKLELTPTAHPLQALATALTYPSQQAPGVEAAATPTELAGWVQAAKALLDPAQPDARVMLVVDQAEELFTLCTDPAQRDTFLDVLAALAASSQDGDGDPMAVVVMGSEPTSTHSVPRTRFCVPRSRTITSL